MLRANQLKRLLTRLVTSSSGISFRSGDFIKLFGWSIGNCATSAGWSSRVLASLQTMSAALPGGLFIGSADQRLTPLVSLAPDDFLRALQETNSLDPSMGGIQIRTKGSVASLLIEWIDERNSPLTTITGTFNESWVDRDNHVESLCTFAKGLALASETEYLFVSHFADEQLKRRVEREVLKRISIGQCAPVPGYGAKPARYLPYIPWLIVFGPRYVNFFTRAVLNRLPIVANEWLGDYFFFTTADSPLEHGTRAVLVRQKALLEALGRDCFFDPSDPHKIARGPKYPAGYKIWPDDPYERWKDLPGVIWDAYLDGDKMDIVSRGTGRK